MKTLLFNETVSLRVPVLSDASDLFALRTDQIVNRYIDRDPPGSVEETVKFIEGRIADTSAYYFIIETRPKREFAGTICLWNMHVENKYAEVGFELLPAFQGKGLMSGALQLLINFAFTELAIETIEAFTHKDNVPSRKLLERFGFTLLMEKSDPGFPDNMIYRKVKLGT